MIEQAYDIDPMLRQRRRRWANIKTTLGQSFVFSGMSLQNNVKMQYLCLHTVAEVR